MAILVSMVKCIYEWKTCTIFGWMLRSQARKFDGARKFGSVVKRCSLFICILGNQAGNIFSDC
jgi:hypothetical protein